VALANCAGMNVQPSELKRLSLWEYEALLSRWNAAHASADDEVEPMPVEHFMEQEQYFMDNPHLLN
jgi:hypothetical protein